MRPSRVRLARCDDLSLPRELDAHALRPASRLPCRARGWRRRRSCRRIFAPAPDGRARSRPRRHGRGRRRARRPRPRRRAGRRDAAPRRRGPATGSSAPPSSSPSVRQTAKSARLPGLERADVVAAEHGCASARAQRQRLARGHRSRPAAAARDEQRLLHLVRGGRSRSFDAEPSTPRPTRTPASRYSRTGATPAPRRRFEVGQCATPVFDAAKSAVSSAERWTQWAHHTSGPSQSEVGQVLDGRAAVELHAVRLLLRRSRRGACGASGRAGARASPTPS